MAILPEELMVLAPHEETGRLLSRRTTDFDVAAAELVELTFAGRVTPDEKDRRVIVLDPRPVGDPDLDAVVSWLDVGGTPVAT